MGEPLMLTEEHVEIILRLFLALVSGGILGYERSRKRVDAGFRTHILVCMSSCAVMITNIHIWQIYQAGDPMRMPSQVISGIGFLGAGCILVTGQHRIKGVTTAAGVWGAACLGLCIGAGDYLVVGFVLIASVLTMTVFRSFDDFIVTKTKYMRLFVELESVSTVSGFLRYLRTNKIRVNDIEFLEKEHSDNFAIVISIQLRRPDTAENVITSLKQVKGTVYISEL